MSLLHAILLGVIQGITEFLPISSDGHLVLANLFLGVDLAGRNALGFDILLHGGSLLALLLVDRRLWWQLLTSPFRRDRAQMKVLLFLALSVIPAAIAGILFEDAIAGDLRTLPITALGFAATGLILIIGERIGRAGAGTIRSLTLTQTLLIGVAQAVALLPGVSRSGSTMSMGRAVGLSRQDALRFSFLMVVPAIAGAMCKTLIDVAVGEVSFPPLSISVAGFVTSFLVSIAAYVLLRTFVSRFSIAWFSLYLLPLAVYLLLQSTSFASIMDAAHVMDVVHRYGAIAIFFFALVETVPPFSLFSPGVLALVLAGSLVQDPLTALLFLAAAVCGVTVGNILLFRLGRRYGRSMAHRLHLTEERLRAADGFLRRFGRISVFIAQFISLTRPAMAIVAGTTRMPPSVYYPVMLLSAVAWAAVNLGIGVMAGGQVLWALSIVTILGYVLPLLGALFVGAGHWQRRHAHDRKKS